MSDWQPSYSSWRHGGWYVDNVHYPSGAVGCVSRNFEDHKWRIVCDKRPWPTPTFPNRDAAASAEKAIADAEWIVARREASTHSYVFSGLGHPDSQPCVTCGWPKRVH